MRLTFSDLYCWFRYDVKVELIPISLVKNSLITTNLLKIYLFFHEKSFNSGNFHSIYLLQPPSFEDAQAKVCKVFPELLKLFHNEWKSSLKKNSCFHAPVFFHQIFIKTFLLLLKRKYLMKTQMHWNKTKGQLISKAKFWSKKF